MKKIGLILLLTVFLLVSISIASAQESNFSAQEGLDWLIDQGADGNYGNIIDTSMVTILLDEIAYDSKALEAYAFLESQIDSNNCWSKGDCKVKDTAFATYAKYSMLLSTEDQRDWFASATTRTSTTGKWWFQMLDTSETGACHIEYSYDDTTGEKDVAVDTGNFTCGGNLWLDLDRCIETNLLDRNPAIDFYIDCNDLGLPDLSLIYNIQRLGEEEYYLGLADQSTGDLEFTINSGCLGEGYRSSRCDYESSLYAYWALDRIGSRTTAPIAYLFGNYDKTATLHNAILYIVKPEENKFRAEELVNRQRGSGDWDNNAYNTAFAILALSKESGEYSEEIAEAKEWLMEKQNEDGSWNNRVVDTALVLYAAFSEEAYSFSSDFGDNGDICDRDGSCERDFGETLANCPSDCYTECNYDGTCEPTIGETSSTCPDCELSRCNEEPPCEVDFGENYIDCPLDCVCGDGVCDTMEEIDEICPEDCPISTTPTPTQTALCGNFVKESGEECDSFDDDACPGDCVPPGSPNECTCKTGGFPWWLLIIIIIIIVILFVYYKYIKKEGKSLNDLFKKKKKPAAQARPEFRPYSSALGQKTRSAPMRRMPLRRPRTIPPRRGRRVEAALDKSLKESKRLFRKK